MEPSFVLLQKNVLDRQRWTSREELRVAVVIWIERTYHRQRQRRLGRLTPVEYMRHSTPLLTQPEHSQPHQVTEVGADPPRHHDLGELAFVEVVFMPSS